MGNQIQFCCNLLQIRPGSFHNAYKLKCIAAQHVNGHAKAVALGNLVVPYKPFFLQGRQHPDHGSLAHICPLADFSQRHAFMGTVKEF